MNSGTNCTKHKSHLCNSLSRVCKFERHFALEIRFEHKQGGDVGNVTIHKWNTVNQNG